MSQRLKLMDAGGNVHVAYKVSGQRYETTDPMSETDEAPRYELEDGRALEHDEETDEFRIAGTGERLTRARTPGA